MKFKNYIETESGIKDTSNSPGTAGQILSSTVTGTSWIDQNTISSGSSEVVDIQVKNISVADGGINLVKGDPVYIYGSVGASARLYVDLANADSTVTNNLGDNKMPCVGLLDQDLAPNGEGTATVVGKLRNLITSPIDGATPSENDTVYVKSGGGLTLTKPTGSTNLIQNVGQVGRVSTSADGNIVVAALLRSNDVPNLPTGRLFVGTATNTSLVSDVVYVDDANDRVGIGTNLPQEKLHIYSTGAGAVRAEIESTQATDALLKYTNSIGSYATFLTQSGQFSIYDYNAASHRFYMLTNGYIGIGTTYPSSKLEVAGDTTGALLTLKSENGGANDAFMRFYDEATGPSYSMGLDSSDEKFKIAFDYDGNSLTNGTKLAMDTSGNVGIGTTDPSTKLHVLGTTSSMPALGAAPSAAHFGGSTYGTLFSTLTSGRGVIQQGRSDGTALSFDLLLQPVGGNVGIGTTSSGAKLDVSGGDIRLATNATYFRLRDTASAQPRVLGMSATNTTYVGPIDSYAGGAIVYGASANVDYHGFYGGGSEKVRITSTGNVGIGTTIPRTKLHVTGLTGDDDPALGSSTAPFFVSNTANSYGLNIGVNNVGASWLQSQSNTSATAYEMSLNPLGGNVGVGFINPSYKLHVNGSIASSVTSGFPELRLSDAVSDFVLTTNSGGDGVIKTEGTSKNIRFFNNSGETMRISGNGNVGIGTTSPDYLFEVEKSTGTGVFTTIANFKAGTDTDNTGAQINVGMNSRGWFVRAGRNVGNAAIASMGLNEAYGTYDYITFKSGNVGIRTTSPSYQLQLASNSAAKPSSSLWTVVSDSRVKENIRDYTTGLEAILKIEPKIYDYNGKAGFEKTKDNIGIIAQDMQTVMPETIKTYNTKLNEDDTEDTELLNFDGHAVTFALINAVKDLKAEIEELKKQINK